MLRFVQLKKLGLILWPLGFLYGSILALRNKFFDWKWFKVYRSTVPVIGVGNLSVGGTGKTPFITFLIAHYQSTGISIAVVSRGYGRKTKGLLQVNENSLASQVGDEPLLLKLRFKDIKVWVCEKRKDGVIAAQNNGAEVVFLDDNFQHRSVQVNYQFMLSRYAHPFFRDFPFPAGRLREFRIGAKRADCIIYTSAPNDFNINVFTNKSKQYAQAQIGFAQHRALPLHWVSNPIKNIQTILAISGIANADGFLAHCHSLAQEVLPFTFKDHKMYNKKDIAVCLAKYRAIKESDKAIVCTEKDWVKIKDRLTVQDFKSIQMAFLPIAIYPLTPIIFPKIQ